MSIYVAWIDFQRRQDSICKLLDIECKYFPVARSAGLLRKLIGYVKNIFLTVSFVGMRKPSVVWVQVPQTPALGAVLMAKWLFRLHLVVVADCHNAMFRKPWSTFPFSKFLLNASDFILVHNDDVRDAAKDFIVHPNKILVVPDAPAVFDANGLESFTANQGLAFHDGKREFSAIFPASWAADEPINELIEAIQRIEDVTLLITGRPKMALAKSLSNDDKVKLTGYLSVNDFDTLLLGADFIFALTRHNDVQLSVCGEALGAGKPLICSDTPTLRRLYTDVAVFATNDAEGLSLAIVEMKERYSSLSRIAKENGERLAEKWMTQYGRKLQALLLK